MRTVGEYSFQVLTLENGIRVSLSETSSISEEEVEADVSVQMRELAVCTDEPFISGVADASLLARANSCETTIKGKMLL